MSEDGGDRWRLGRRPELDALRGIAVLLVVVSHAYPALQPAGMAGVAIFFALSGFLITSLLLAEHDTTGHLDLPGFFRRRAVRLLPALVLLLVVLVAAGQLLDPRYSSPGSALQTLFYVRDLRHTADGSSHTWSLAVEEQFYLVFPLLLLVTVGRLGRRTLLAAVLLLVAVSLWCRFGLHAPDAHGPAYLGPDSNAALLLLGAATAIWMTTAPRPRRAHPRIAWAVLAAAVVWGLTVHSVSKFTLVPVVAAAATAVVLCLLVPGPAGTAVWRVPRWLVAVSHRSYGLYLWHHPLLIVTRAALPDSPLTVPLLVLASWGCACLSWRYVEQPAQRWLASRTGSTPRTGVPGRTVRPGAAVR